MTYEITTPGRHDERACMNATFATLDQARKSAKAMAQVEQKTMLIERVTKRGMSTIIERVDGKKVYLGGAK